MADQYSQYMQGLPQGMQGRPMQMPQMPSQAPMMPQQQDQTLQLLLQEVRSMSSQMTKMQDKINSLEELSQRVLAQTKPSETPLPTPSLSMPSTAAPEPAPAARPPTMPFAPTSLPQLPQQPPAASIPRSQQIQFDDRLIQDACKVGFSREAVNAALYSLYYAQKPCNDLNILLDELSKTAGAPTSQAPPAQPSIPAVAPAAAPAPYPPTVQFDERLVQDACRLGHTRDQVVKALNDLYTAGKPCNDLNILLDELQH
eukprot:gnl/Trimastix_PCT/466.p2 GENE.gnl/Trimastix_PCT/466~~gnl/Trimastix_PCT/466.p2  ORF type:complete len:289 (-),score=56.53 gnl/Trimastix_PCT/466:863-1633(-)